MSRTQKSVSIYTASPSPSRLSRRDIGAAISIAVLVVVSRAPVLLQSVASADEGLYALVARELLRGHLPYVTVWETKPPLLFALLAGAFALFGTSAIALRLATDIAITVTALALYAIGTSLPRDGRTVGYAAALLYAALMLSDSASSALAETFYAPFIAVALASTLVRSRDGERCGAWAYCAIGACLGCAVLVKESAALEAAFAAFVVLRTAGARAVVPLLAGIGAAIACAVAPFAAGHALAVFWDANYAAVARRAFVPVSDATPFFDVLRAQLFAFFPVTLLAFGVPWFFRSNETARAERQLAGLVLLWAAVDLVTVAAIREYLGNHFIPLMAPVSMLGALVVVRAGRSRGIRALVPATLALGLFAHSVYQMMLAVPIVYERVARRDATFGDTTAQLATFLVTHATAHTTLYVADDRTMLYVLTGLRSPTRYAYCAHLLDPYQETIAGIDGPVEIARVLNLHPSFVVRDLKNRLHEDARGRHELDVGLARAYAPAFARGSRTIYALTGKS